MIVSYFDATGQYLPSRVLTNTDLQAKVDTSDEWITSRTGIKERRICNENESSFELAYQAALDVLSKSLITVESLDLIVVATCSPDMFFPSVSCLLQGKLGAINAAAFDISAACSGFVYGLSVVDSLIRCKTYKNVLLVGVDALSKFIDWTDRSTCVLFGDGAGSALLTGCEKGDSGVLSIYLGADGKQSDILSIPSGGSLDASNEPVIQMDGASVYRYAILKMINSIDIALKMANKSIDDIELFIPHQANHRIIDSIRKRLNVSIDRFFVNLDKYGNTSASSVIIALNEAIGEKRVKKGDHVVLVTFGAGVTWASTVIRI